MNPIGGYFELELPRGEEYHKNAIRLNTGRNAFEYILRAKGYQKVFLPYYTCDVMLEPINKLDLDVEFYNIDKNFIPVFDFAKVRLTDVFVYTNYFGICDIQVNYVSQKCKNLIIDNSQAFFSKPLRNVDTFYSSRKFFGVPDGAYLYSKTMLEDEFETDISYDRCKHLLGRIDVNAMTHYNTFKHNEKQLKNQSIKKMSKLTQRLLQSISYEDAATKRRRNFMHYHALLSDKNQLTIEMSFEAVPMVYPYLARNHKQLIEKLISEKVFTATYWLNVKNWLTDTASIELDFCNNLIALPVDQRYNHIHIDKIMRLML